MAKAKREVVRGDGVRETTFDSALLALAEMCRVDHLVVVYRLRGDRALHMRGFGATPQDSAAAKVLHEAFEKLTTDTKLMDRVNQAAVEALGRESGSEVEETT
jgi:hypothetical protein